MENIDSIKIVQVEGLNGGGGAAGVGGGGSQEGNLSDQVVSSALRYRAQAPLVDQLLSEVGLSGADLNGLTGALRTPAPQAQSPSQPVNASDDVPQAD